MYFLFFSRMTKHISAPNRQTQIFRNNQTIPAYGAHLTRPMINVSLHTQPPIPSPNPAPFLN